MGLVRRGGRGGGGLHSHCCISDKTTHATNDGSMHLEFVAAKDNRPSSLCSNSNSRHRHLAQGSQEIHLRDTTDAGQRVMQARGSCSLWQMHARPQDVINAPKKSSREVNQKNSTAATAK